MNHATSDKAVSKLRQWILEFGGRVDDGALQPDTNLLDEEYIDSLGLMSLMLFIENLRGGPINEKDMSVQNFASLRQIEKTFFPGSDGVAQTSGTCFTVSAGSTKHA